MKLKKKILSAVCLLTAAAIPQGCGIKPVHEPDITVETVSERKAPVTTEAAPDMFSVMNISDGKITADGYYAGESFCGFTVKEDGSVTVNVDGEELAFSEAAEKTGCTLTEKPDGSIVIQAPFQKSQVIVKSEKEFDTFGAESVEETVKNHFLLTYSSPSEAYSAYRLLSEDENIEFAEPNEIVKSAGFKETKRIDTWGLNRIGAVDFCRELSEKNSELPEVDVAVIDTGIFYGHSLFEGRILEGGRTFCDGYSPDEKNSASDDMGHGTHCAGIICSATNDNVKILPVKVLDSEGYGTSYEIYCGMMYAADCGSDVISMSLGSYGKSNLFAEAVKHAQDKGITVCVAAGNDSSGCDDSYSSLSGIEDCVVVSSLDEELNPSEFSNFQNIDFAAPGEEIVSASIYGPDDSVAMSGTSMAAPYAAACFANVLSADSTLSPDEVYDIVKANAVDLCEPGFDDMTGWGMVNLKKFHMDTEMVDDPELRPSAAPSFRPSDAPPVRDGETFESDQFYIENGVLYFCDAFDKDVIDFNELIKNKVIPEFYEVGSGAFCGMSIREVILPDSVDTIGSSAFAECSSLRKVVTNAEYIGDSAFEYCTSLKELCDSSIKSVGDCAFLNCKSLETADFTGVTEIPYMAFTRCRSLKSESFSFENITLVEPNAFQLSGISGKINLSSAENIYSEAFSETAIEEIILSDKIEFLPEGIFSGCSSLKKISAPSVTSLGDRALALSKYAFSRENAVETDIDFSKITYLSEYFPLDGFVFSGPVSFDSITNPSMSSIAGAYGESISFPAAEYVQSGVYANVYADALYFESVKNLDFSDTVFNGVVGVGDRLENVALNQYTGINDIWFCSLNDDPDVADCLRQQGIICHRSTEAYIPDVMYFAPAFCPYGFHAVLPGRHLTYTYTVVNNTTGQVIASAENSDYSLSFIPVVPGELHLNLEVKDPSGKTVFTKDTALKTEEYECIPLKTDEEVFVSELSYGYAYDSVFSFTPEADGEYWLSSSGYDNDIFVSGGYWTHTDQHTGKLNLKGGETYYIGVRADKCISISVNSEESDLINISEAAECSHIQLFAGKNGSRYVSFVLPDGTQLTEGVDFRCEITPCEDAVFSDYCDVLIFGTGRYFGIYSNMIVLHPLAELNERIGTETYAVDFIPEKSGVYNIIITPDREEIENAIEKDTCVAEFRFNPMLEFFDAETGREIPYEELYNDREIEYTGQSEISVYLDENVRCRISNYPDYNSYLSYSEFLVTEKPSVSQCDAEYSFSYELTGEPVIPDIRLTDGGKVLEEGKDYTLTVWKNTSPGLMFAMAEGCGDYSGIRNFAMVIEGGNISGGKSGELNVVDVKPDETFEYLGSLPYRITFDRDTFVSVTGKNSRNFYSHFRKPDSEIVEAEYFRDENDELVSVKKGTYYFDASTSEYFPPHMYRKEIRVNTAYDVKLISDAEVNIIYGSYGEPEITLIYDGETLKEDEDYILITEKDEKTVTVKGINGFTGQTEVKKVILPHFRDDAEMHEGANTVDTSSNLRYVFSAESERYVISSSSYITSETAVVDENGKLLWSGDVNIKKEAEVFMEPGRKYFIYVMCDFDEEMVFSIRTDGRLSDCSVQYEALVLSGRTEAPDVVFTDGSYVLEEGKDYVLSSDGFVNDAGIREYVYRGCGKYYGDAVVNVTAYAESINDFEEYTEAETDVPYYFEFEFFRGYKIGSKIKLKLTSEHDSRMLYHVMKQSLLDNEESLKYISIFMYDADGKFIGANDDVRDFELEKGQTVYVMAVPPYFNDEIEQEDAYGSAVYFTAEKAAQNEPLPELSGEAGDVNCDGTVNIIDFVCLRSFIVGKGELSENGIINSMLAGTENREVPDSRDLIILKRILMN